MTKITFDDIFLRFSQTTKMEQFLRFFLEEALEKFPKELYLEESVDEFLSESL